MCSKFETECVKDLDLWSEMIIFDSILTTSSLALILEASGAVA